MTRIVCSIMFMGVVIFWAWHPAIANENGKRIYEKYCVKCHGEDGSVSEYGRARKARDLRTNRLFISPKELLVTVKYGVYGREMKGWSDILTNDEVKDVAQYIRTLSYKPDPKNGEGLFNLRCASCHAKEGAAKKLFGAPDLDMSPLGEREMAQVIRFGRHNTVMFPKETILLNPEIANIVAYLISIKK